MKMPPDIYKDNEARTFNVKGELVKIFCYIYYYIFVIMQNILIFIYAHENFIQSDL
jgi:hypothetical protein